MFARLCFGLILNYHFCGCFNFDTQFPIIYNDPHKNMGIYSNKSSYFGYSIIMYKGKTNQHPWVQVGSPRSEDPSLPESTPGAVFRCNLERCKMITVDRDNGVSKYYGLTYVDKKKDAWIGGTMDILPKDDVLLVCGFRWSAKVAGNVQPFMMGSCYWSNLDDISVYRKIIPLYDSSRFYINNGNKYYYNLALGQSGFSAQLVKDKYGPAAYLGAPGAVNWEGTTAFVGNLTTIDIYANIPSENYNGVVYRGYAVTSGNYLKKSKQFYVASLPHAEYMKGMIEVFTFANENNRTMEIADKRSGTQMGEYFGGAMSSGDINSDGYTDLLVGAPFHKVSQYNEGCVYVFFGGEKTLRPQGRLFGSSAKGQFGSTIAYLGDFDLDGFGDFAIAAPYEDNAGVIYIYRGSSNGLISQPSQVIPGKSIDPKIRGFGISFSKPTDIDKNGYEDLAVGAYLSGTAVVLRARPVLKLRQSLTVWGKKFTFTTSVMQVCLWFEGSFLPQFVVVNRTIVLDKNYGRLQFENPQDAVKQVVLHNERQSCTNYTVRLKEAVTNFKHLVHVQVIQSLLEENRTSEPFIVGTSKINKFCNTCPVMVPYTPLDAFVSFALGCGDDICKSHLTFDSTFSHVDKSNAYIVGSTERITMTTIVSNSGKMAYSTILTFELPQEVYLAFTPKFCTEGNSSLVIYCLVANTLDENEVKSVQLMLNVQGFGVGAKKEEVSFTVTVTTSSENLNNVQRKTFTLKLISEADVLLTGKSNQLTYSYGNIDNGNSTFSQIYQITKFGKSPIEEITLHMHIPIALKTPTGEISFLKLYPTVGQLAGQPISCKNITYVEYVNQIINEDQSATIELSSEPPPPPPQPRLLKRSATNFDEMGIVYTNNLNNTEDEYKSAALESNETYIPLVNTYEISCSENRIKCATIRCVAGPFRSEQHVGVIQMKAYFNVSVLKDLIGVRTKIAFSTSGKVSIEDFQQSGNKDDETSVTTIFVGEILSTPVALWIVLLTIIVGLLLLLILTLCLYKAGFFKREDKMKLEALKKQEVEEEFLSAEAKEEETECDPKGIDKRASTEFEEMKGLS